MASMQDCITNCLDCHSVCLATIGHCLDKGGDHAAPKDMRLMQDSRKFAPARSPNFRKRRPCGISLCPPESRVATPHRVSLCSTLQAGIRCGLDATSTTKGPARDGAESMWL